MMDRNRPLRIEALSAGVALLFLLGLVVGAVGQTAADLKGSGGDGDKSASKPKVVKPDKSDKGDKGDKSEKLPSTIDIQASKDGSDRIESFSVQNQDVRQSLRLLGFKYKKNIVVSPNVSGKVTLDLYDVSIKQVLDAVMAAVGCRYRADGEFIYVYTEKEFEQLEKTQKRMETQVFRLWYTTANDIKAFVKPALSEAGEISVTPSAIMGVPKSDSDAGGNRYASVDMLVVRDFPENLKVIGKIIADIDVKPQQVLVEAVILVTKLDEKSSLGVNFNALAGVNFRNINATSTSGIADLVPGTLTSDELKFASANGRTDFAPVKDGLRFGFISNQIALFVSALETVSDTTVLANPKLLVMDRQRGEVLIGDRQGYKTTTVSEGISTETIEFLETGTRLVVRPFVCKDGQVRLELHPEESTGGLDASGLPQESTTTVTSNVMVRDGHTIVIGGLFREETGDTRKQVPVLGNLPYVGTLFRATDDATKRSEIIILITPHIVQQDAAEAVGAQVRDDCERFRVGQRNGLRCWSRSRLAGACLREARTAMQCGDVEKAVWYTDMTLSMNPTMEEAIRLKERLTARAYWADQPQISSVQFVIQRMLMAELGKPYRPTVYPQRPRDPGAELDPAIRRAYGMTPLIEEPPIPAFRSGRERAVLKKDPKKADQKDKALPPQAK